MAEAQEFKAGDKVVYPHQGVVEVEGVETKDIAGTTQAFYVLKSIDTRRKIMVPTKTAATIGLRPLVGEDGIEAIFEVLRDDGELLFDKGSWHKRFKGYQELLNTGDVLNTARVVRDLTVLKKTKELAFSERRMLESAQTRIIQEIALARDMDPAIVEEEVTASIAA